MRSADQIAVVDQGRIAEIGTHASLVAAQGLYHHLLAAQAIQEEEGTDHGIGPSSSSGVEPASASRVILEAPLPGVSETPIPGLAADAATAESASALEAKHTSVNESEV